MLVSAHGDVLFAPPDGTSDWREEFEWLELLIFPDMKVALRSYHGRFLSDQLDGGLVWNKETIGRQELWGLQLLRFVPRLFTSGPGGVVDGVDGVGVGGDGSS